MNSLTDKFRDAWYGLAARRVAGKPRKKNPYSKKNMQHVPAVVETVREFRFLTLRGSGAYPVYIKVRYTVNYEVYCKREVISSQDRRPYEGQNISVVFPKGNPRKALCIF